MRIAEADTTNNEAVGTPSRPSLRDPSLLRSLNYINGEWVGADDLGVTRVVNPASGQQIGTVPAMGAAETRRAIEAAEAAFPKWRAMLASERGKILRKLSDLMLENADDLAAILTAEQGKPLA
ncbi:MAG TPA: aldehyde dehydrogenase family protein, partial [Bosea sp. (in: a-proteobacteria)]